MEARPDVICAGQCVIDCITLGREQNPYKKDVYRADNIVLRLGGDASNEARVLAAHGYKAAVAAGIGDDLAGNLICSELSALGIDISRIRKCVPATPVAGIQVSKDGSRLSVNSGATRLPGCVIPTEDLLGARAVSLASMFRPPLADPEALFAAVSAAKKGGAVICADTKLPLDESMDFDAFRNILPLIDFFFPNEKEAAFYSGKDSFPKMAAFFRNCGVGSVIIKAGPLGCYALGEAGEFSLPAAKVDVVDTTGAGDSFVAGFIMGLLEGASFRDCAELAIKQAGEAVSHIGA